MLKIYMSESNLFEKRENIAQKLLQRLPDLARIFIENIPENENFIKNPDDPAEHHKRWHQFGIITHTRKFLEFYNHQMPEYLKKWGMEKEINEKLTRKIAHKTKDELLRIAIVLHDLGKFDRDFEEKDEELEPDYKGHERKSETFILKNEKVYNLLKNTYGLTENQIEYIAGCAGLHYELGKMRKAAKESLGGFNLEFVKSEKCRQLCRKITADCADFKFEIGVLFLGDSLSKTNVMTAAGAESDREIEDLTDKAKKVITKRNLNPNLIKTILQVPIQTEMARVYFEEVLKNQ